MPSRTMLAVSLAANLALVCVIVWLAKTRLFARPVPVRATAHVAAKQARQTGTPAASPQPATKPDTTPRALASSQLTNEPFHWAQLQPADFRNYTTNLRAVGCPEKTVRDIVLPAIARKYKEHREDVPVRAFWQSGGALRASQLAERRRTEALDAERTALLRALFGLDRVPYRHELDENKLFNDVLIGLCLLGFLPEEKYDAVFDGFLRAEEAKSAVESAADEILFDEDRKKLSRLYDATRDELRRLVGTQDFDEGERRIHGLMLAMEWLNTQQSPGAFEMTGAEFREFTGRAMALRDPMRADFVQDEPHDSDAKEHEKTALDELARSFFGEARFAELERSRDSDFREIFDTASEHKVPRAQAVKAHELLRAAAEHAEQLGEDASLTDAQRSAAFAVLRADFERGCVAALGPAAAKDYLKKTSFLKPPDPPDAKRISNKAGGNP